MQHQKIKHKYIDSNPINKDSEAIILGTIYPCKCHSEEEFELEFFYGNTNSLWSILENIYGKSLKTVDEIKSFLAENKIAISDTIRKAKRKDGASCSDDSFETVTSYNDELIEQIKNSKIETIYFTSIAARRKFSHIYSTRIGSLRKENIIDKKIYKDFPKKGEDFSKSGSKFEILESSYFGKGINCCIIPSPSPRAKASKSDLYREQNNGESYVEWRINYYKDIFSK